MLRLHYPFDVTFKWILQSYHENLLFLILAEKVYNED